VRNGFTPQFILLNCKWTLFSQAVRFNDSKASWSALKHYNGLCWTDDWSNTIHNIGKILKVGIFEEFLSEHVTSYTVSSLYPDFIYLQQEMKVMSRLCGMQSGPGKSWLNAETKA